MSKKKQALFTVVYRVVGTRNRRGGEGMCRIETRSKWRSLIGAWFDK